MTTHKTRQLDQSKPIGVAGPPPIIPNEQKVTFDSLLRVAKAQGSVDQTLRILNKTSLEYLKFHTLMYNSFSIQQSDFIRPRAIVFGPDAHFIFSFNDEKMPGGDTIETVEFSDQEAKFLFREIIFKHPLLDRSAIDLKKSEIAYEDGKVIVSQPNPAKCMACHGPNSNPVWSTYFLWPGAYGSNFNYLYLSFNPEDRLPTNKSGYNYPLLHSQGPPITLQDGITDNEVQGMISYLKSKSSHPRYRWLPPQITDQGFARLAAGESMGKIDLSAEIQKENERVKANRLWPQRPNQFFQLYLEHLNQKRVIRAIQNAGMVANELKGPSWKSLDEDGAGLDLAAMSKRIETLLNQYKFRHAYPTTAQIEDRLRQNMIGEMNMERETIVNIMDNFGRNSLTYNPSQPEYSDQRFGIPWLSPIKVVDFYQTLLGLKTISENDRIAIGTDGENHAVLLALQLILEDRGVELENYNLNHRQMGMSFYLQGMQEVAEFLGIDDEVTGEI